MKVIPCIGEKLDEREAGKTNDVVFHQMKFIKGQRHNTLDQFRSRLLPVSTHFRSLFAFTLFCFGTPTSSWCQGPWTKVCFLNGVERVPFRYKPEVIVTCFSDHRQRVGLEPRRHRLRAGVGDRDRKDGDARAGAGGARRPAQVAHRQRVGRGRRLRAHPLRR